MRGEPGWARIGRGFWGAAIAATAIVLLCAVNSAGWVNRQFPGFFLWENLFVPAVGDTDWTGYQAGVPYRSRLLAVDGRTVTSATQVYAAAERAPADTALRYAFQLSDGTTETLAVPPMRFTLAEYLWTLGNYLVVGVLLTLLGFVVYFLRPDVPGARAMLAACGTWGLYLVTSADIFGPAWFRPLCLVLQALGPVTLVHLALTFPIERAAARRRPWMLPILYAAALAVGIAHNLAFHRSFRVLLAIDRLNSIALVGGGILLIASLAEAWLRPPSAAARQRTKIAALGGAAAFVLPVAGFFAYYLLGLRFPLNFVTFSIMVFPAAIAYAIVQHDLFEVDTIIRRTVAWAILSALIAAVYLSGVGVIDVLFAGRSGRIAQVAFLLAIVALVNPLRDRVQVLVDRLFARERYDYQRTVTRVSGSLARLLDVDAIVGQILTTVTAAMRVDFGAVWLRDDAGAYRLHERAGPRATGELPQLLGAADVLVQRLAAAPERPLTDQVAERAPELGAALAALHATLLVPIAFEQRLVGFIVLGMKESGRFYSGEDLGLLQTLASQAAVALQNARSYSALERTNEELRGTQAQLIQAERFAAIGEVSAAVAHGIRNPLAGIKAAARVVGIQVGGDHAAQETIGDIVTESNKLEARIKALLDFAKPFEPHRAPVAIAELIDEAVAALRTQIQAGHISVRTELDGALPPACVDRGQIVEVLLVLLANAIEAMPKGGTLTIRAASAAGAGGLRVEVLDTGTGISPSQLARLFHLFATTKPTGNGLGLAVAKKIVERHGGSIAAQSTPGEGSCFTIVLPIG